MLFRSGKVSQRQTCLFESFERRCNTGQRLHAFQFPAKVSGKHFHKWKRLISGTIPLRTSTTLVFDLTVLKIYFLVIHFIISNEFIKFILLSHFFYDLLIDFYYVSIGYRKNEISMNNFNICFDRVWLSHFFLSAPLLFKSVESKQKRSVWREYSMLQISKNKKGNQWKW